VDRLAPIERAILTIAGCELLRHPEVPYRVVINEAVELAKSFGGTDGHKYVNGVLDKLAATLREPEVRQARAAS
jgi:N utilization substance protein B